MGAAAADERRRYCGVADALRSAESRRATRSCSRGGPASLDGRPGFGPVFSLTVRAEIGTITRFPDGPHLASYAGLVPRVERSGGRSWTGRITKTGSPWLRWTLIEAAIHNFRRQDEFGRRARRLAVRKGLLKARVAVARALCDEIIVTWRAAM